MGKRRKTVSRIREARRFFRSAQQRLTTGQFLYDHDIYLDAIYLAGYAPECGLKSLLLSHVPARRQKELLEGEFRGNQGHNLDHLLWLVRQTGIPVPKETLGAIAKVRSIWTTELRYESGIGDPNDALDVLQAGKTILDWVSRSSE